ncbi:hypothetical protein D3C78_1114470 [compost metagenome]
MYYHKPHCGKGIVQLFVVDLAGICRSISSHLIFASMHPLALQYVEDTSLNLTYRPLDKIYSYADRNHLKLIKVLSKFGMADL